MRSNFLPTIALFSRQYRLSTATLEAEVAARKSMIYLNFSRAEAIAGGFPPAAGEPGA
jgi:hypothetical protein